MLLSIVQLVVYGFLTARAHLHVQCILERAMNIVMYTVVACISCEFSHCLVSNTVKWFSSVLIRLNSIGMSGIHGI